MNVVDSSGWLEYFADEPNAGRFAAPLGNAAELLVPSITLYKVFKVVCRQRGEDAALQAVAMMQQGRVIELSSSIALLAAKLSLDVKIPALFWLRRRSMTRFSGPRTTILKDCPVSDIFRKSPSDPGWRYHCVWMIRPARFPKSGGSCCIQGNK